MLYPTHQPFFFPFNPFTISIIPSPHTTTTTTTADAAPLPPIQVEQAMECVEGALKSSFRPEMSVKRTPQGFSDDLLTVNGQNDVSGDEFFVDDLLDFSKEGIEDGFFDEEDDTKACSVSVFPQKRADKEPDSDPTRSNFSAVDDFGSVPGSELSVPDDLADLEWLSHFVEDSFSEYSLTYPAGKLSEKPAGDGSEPAEIPFPTNPCFTTPVQTKARSKRTRTGGRVWSLGSTQLTESSSSSSSSTTTSLSSPSNPWLIYSSASQTAESLLGHPPPAKKPKKKQEAAGGSSGSQQPRRCSHCLVQKTPQWRTGPLGAKTLCNACGVRYKSGRLLPEYRPACSPTFSSVFHSNNHRKVLEMRRKKELEEGPAPPVQSF